MSDDQDEVRDLSLSSKVKPISFEDVVNKEYRVFSNDEYYTNPVTTEVRDLNNKTREVTSYSTPTLDEEYYENHGIRLQIKGILRAKQTSTFSILSPGLCYTKELQDHMLTLNANSAVDQTIGNNMVFRSGDSSSTVLTFIDEIYDLLSEYESGSFSTLPTDQVNDIFNRYFVYYPIVTGGSMYAGFSRFFTQAKSIGAELVQDDMKSMDFNSIDQLNSFMDSLVDLYRSDYDELYRRLISFISYVNAYATAESLVIFPVDLAKREVLIEILDSYNEIDPTSSSHAANASQQVFYAESDVNYMIQDVSDMISLVNLILIIFAVVSLIVSSLMTSLMISVNVLERKKEIGLLRSFGTRKVDILSLFEVESLAIGLIAGIVSSIATSLLAIPINYLINYYFSYYSVGRICNFTFLHAIIITLLSCLLSFIAALIPSKRASDVDPVQSLRSE